MGNQQSLSKSKCYIVTGIATVATIDHYQHVCIVKESRKLRMWLKLSVLSVNVVGMQ